MIAKYTVLEWDQDSMCKVLEAVWNVLHSCDDLVCRVFANHALKEIISEDFGGFFFILGPEFGVLCNVEFVSVSLGA